VNPRPVAREQWNVIGVGVDGSEPARRALRWALREAELRAGGLHAVSAFQAPLLGTGEFPWSIAPLPSYVEMEVDELRRAARERLTEAVRDAAADEGVDVPTQLFVVESPAAPALLDASRDADLLVVGSRGRGGFTGLLLGSVSRHCSEHAACPVVIVR
jgi:nucleotide-binding universal stress UspA family protein